MLFSIIYNTNDINQILDILMESRIKLKKEHFELAIVGLRMNERNKEAVERVIVNGEQPAAVAKSINMAHSQLGRQVKRVVDHFFELLEYNGLYYEEAILDKKMRPITKILESLCIEDGLRQPPKKKGELDEEE